MNFVDESSRRFDYENENDDDDICLSTFQNKLRNIVIANIDFSIKFDNCEKISNEKLIEKNSKNFIIVIKQTMRCEKVVETCNKKIHMKIGFKIFSIKLKNCNCLTSNASNIAFLSKKNKKSKNWTLNSNNILRYWHTIYVSNETNLKTKILKRCHDDSLTKHFETKKND